MKKLEHKDRFTVQELDLVKQSVLDSLSTIKKKRLVSYADIRLEASEGTVAVSEDGSPKITSQDWGLSLGIRVISGNDMKAAGYYGCQIGLSDVIVIEKLFQNAFDTAYLRAAANAKRKKAFYAKATRFHKTIQSTKLADVPVIKDIVEADFTIDPRTVSVDDMTTLACDSAATALKYHTHVKKAEVIVHSGISRQFFSSSEGSFIDQSSCSTGGTIFVVAQNNNGDKPADLYHHTGNQLGFEAITEGKNAHKLAFQDFSQEIAKEAVLIANAKPAPAEDKPVTVVIDPDLVALFAHEIIGHPSELDRALKMEAGYAGRSWFFDDLTHTQQGKQVGSKFLTAFSDPTLRGGYGYYRYDDEGTPAKRVYHIKNGVYKDFMNSRQTAYVFRTKPNGHYKANDASVIPLIRMSVSAIEAGKDDPKEIISQVKRGYYCVGHRIPSISESRENFQIAPRLIYEIKNGKIGQVFRDGRVTADSKDFFMSIDAVGNDFTIFPIPNCGKGQPMQAKQVGNGGPTIRARAKIARGSYK